MSFRDYGVQLLEIDRRTERHLGRQKLDTTKRGIEPGYVDAAARLARD